MCTIYMCADDDTLCGQSEPNIAPCMCVCVLYSLRTFLVINVLVLLFVCLYIYEVGVWHMVVKSYKLYS